MDTFEKSVSIVPKNADLSPLGNMDQALPAKLSRTHNFK